MATAAAEALAFAKTSAMKPGVRCSVCSLSEDVRAGIKAILEGGYGYRTAARWVQSKGYSSINDQRISSCWRNHERK